MLYPNIQQVKLLNNDCYQEVKVFFLFQLLSSTITYGLLFAFTFDQQYQLLFCIISFYKASFSYAPSTESRASNFFNIGMYTQLWQETTDAIPKPWQGKDITNFSFSALSSTPLYITCRNMLVQTQKRIQITPEANNTLNTKFKVGLTSIWRLNKVVRPLKWGEVYEMYRLLHSSVLSHSVCI